jgi:FixJ family two-component response regulator
VQKNSMILIVGDEEPVREGTMDQIEATRFIAEAFEHAGDFLKSNRLRYTSCLVADVKTPGSAGLKPHSHLVGSNVRVAPIVSASVAFQQAGRP